MRSFFGKISNPSILGRLVNLIITHLLLFPFPKRWIEVDCDFLGEENKNTWAVHISALSVLILLGNQLMLINTCNALNAVQSVREKGAYKKTLSSIYTIAAQDKQIPKFIIVSSDFYYYPQPQAKTNYTIDVVEPYMWVWGGGCKLSNPCLNVRVCALISKIREVRGSLQFACILSWATCKRRVTFRY